MTDQEWERICNRAILTHTLALATLIMVPGVVWGLAPEFVARFDAWLTVLPDIVEVVIRCAWFVCIIGCFFPPRRIFGRGVWVVLTIGVFALGGWAVINDMLGDAGSVTSVVWVLLLCLCVAGIIFDGPKSWERRYAATPEGR